MPEKPDMGKNEFIMKKEETWACTLTPYGIILLWFWDYYQLT